MTVRGSLGPTMAPPQTRSSSDGCLRGRGCCGGRSAGELSTEVPGRPLVAGETDLGVVARAADDELVEWWQDREEGWDSDAVLNEWDSVQTSDGYAEVHKTVFFLEGVDERPLDPEGQLLVWGRHVLLRDLRGAVHRVPVQLNADYQQFAACCTEQREYVLHRGGYGIGEECDPTRPWCRPRDAVGDEGPS